MSESGAEISVDATGARTLFLRGEWSEQTAALLRRDDWEVLAIFGVEWPDYQCLVPHASRIRRLRVPFGPDSSKGLEALTEISELRSTDVLRPAVDFRKLMGLRVLESVWDRKNAQFFANPEIEHLVIHSIGGADVSWIPKGGRLKRLELLGGRLLSLAGLTAATALEELRVSELRNLTDVSSVEGLRQLKVLELDAPNASFLDLSWVREMHNLRRILLSSETKCINWAELGEHPVLRSIEITGSSDLRDSNATIRAELMSRCTKTLVSFERMQSSVPAFSIVLR